VALQAVLLEQGLAEVVVVDHPMVALELVTVETVLPAVVEQVAQLQQTLEAVVTAT
jgi:hypothetical protein